MIQVKVYGVSYIVCESVLSQLSRAVAMCWCCVSGACVLGRFTEHSLHHGVW